MNEINDKNLVTVKIHSLGYCSEGIGKVINGKYEGMTAFINNTTIGDLVNATVISSKKSYIKAKLIDIIDNGSTRVNTKCSLAKICGGCQWQQVDYNIQLEYKTKIVHDNICKIGGINDVIVKQTLASPDIWNFRAKVQLPLGITKKSKRLLIGYYRYKTHEIINIKYCPVQPKEFDLILLKLRELHNQYKLKIYDESTNKGYLRHFIIRKSFYNNSILITFIVNSNTIDSELILLSKQLTELFPQISGVTVNFNTKNTNVILGENSHTIVGTPYIIEKIGNKFYHISSKSFFQINPQAASILFKEIYNIIKDSKCHTRMLDIYAGVGAISIYVSEMFEKIVAIENEPSCYPNFLKSAELNNINNIEFINLPAAQALRKICDLDNFDFILLDPPRSGCEVEVLNLCSKIKSGSLIYVSCNPATLARDIKILSENGFILQYIQPIDMFCHTYHVESICLLTKNI